MSLKIGSLYINKLAGISGGYIMIMGYKKGLVLRSGLHEKLKNAYYVDREFFKLNYSLIDNVVGSPLIKAKMDKAIMKRYNKL